MRQYLTVKAESFVDFYGDFRTVRERTFEVLRELGAPRSLMDELKDIEVVGTPSLDYRVPGKDDTAAKW